MRRKTGAGAVLMLAAVLSWASSAQAAGSITSYTDGLLEASPGHIVGGPEGNLWFTANSRASGRGRALVGRITPSGSITTYSAGLGSGSSPSDITVGSDGDLWFTDCPVRGRGTPAIGRITPSGTITEFTEAHDENGDPIELSEPLNIVPGSEGNLWFTDWAYLGGQPAIGRITPTGVITEFKLPADSLPTSIVVGPDGNLWFTDSSRVSGGIGRITPAGVVTEFSTALLSGTETTDIIAGPDGNLWFTDSPIASQGPAAIGRITTSGAITEFTEGLQAEADPQEIVPGPEGNLWFTDRGGFGNTEGEHPFTGMVGRITPAGSITEYGHGLPAGPLAVGPDGNIWVGDNRVTPSGQVTHFWLGLLEDASPTDSVADPDGEGLWFTSSGYNGSGEATGAIGKVSPVGPTGTTPAPTVEVGLADSGTGMVTSSPPGISCPGVCSSHFAPGTQVTLTATAASGSLLYFQEVQLGGETTCPSEFGPPPRPRQSSVCTFTVEGDAFDRVGIEPGELEEPSTGGGGTPPSGGGADPTGGSSASGGSSTAPAPATSPKPKPKRKPLKCRKGFRRQKVHGKAKCVKAKQKRGSGATLGVQPLKAREPQKASEPSFPMATHESSESHRTEPVLTFLSRPAQFFASRDRNQEATVL